ncbi:MAG TPA: TonB-dependent receptor, partial [Pyrinomonadaceae bacterium]
PVGTIFDANGVPFAGNVIPQNRLSPVAVRFFNSYPLPTSAGRENNYRINRVENYDQDAYDVRIDHRINGANSLFGRYSKSTNERNRSGNFPLGSSPTGLDLASGGAAGTEFGNSRQIALGDTHIFGPNVINDLRAGYTRVGVGINLPGIGGSLGFSPNVSTELGVPNVNVCGAPCEGTVLVGVLPSDVDKQLEFVGDGGPFTFTSNNFFFGDTLTVVRGNMSFKFGGDLRVRQVTDFDGGRAGFTKGNVRYDTGVGGTFISGRDGLPVGAQDAGSSYANILLGYAPTDIERGFPGGPFLRSNKEIAFYVQDDWKVRPDLTLNLGLRYEYFSPLREKRGRLSNFVFGPPGQELTGGRLAVVDELYEPDRNNFAPRLGFAWSPTKILGTDFTNKMVVRGGFGVAYNRLPVNVFENTRGNPPFFARYNVCCGTSAQDFSTPFAGGQILYALGASNSPFSYPVNPALALTFNPTTGIPNVRPGSEVEIYGAPQDVSTPYVYTYSLETQYSLPGNLTAEVGYQGSSSHKLVRLVDQRFLYPNDPGSFFASRIIFPLTDTNANYNAMLARITRRFSRGFQFDAHYRWSKSIDVISSEQIGAPNPTYPLDPRQERGPSDFDVRHHFIASGLWDLPIFRDRKDLLGKTLGGWQLSGILTRHTGFPWTPLLSDCVSTRGPSLCPARPVAYFG